MITIRHWARLTIQERRALLDRGETMRPDIKPIVKRILSDVQTNGDSALLRLEYELDHVDLSRMGLRVSDQERIEAEEDIPTAVKSAIVHAIANIKRFHEKQLPKMEWSEELSPGVRAGELTRAIASVGLYVPRGKGSFPSVMAMLGVPATIAGVSKIVVASPPDQEGRVDPAVLYVANQLGISTILRIGGAQAIAAMAYGTETVPRVAKILGPGSAYVAYAKQLLASRVDIGLQSGPSEALIIADDSADARIVALDLINEAEHGPDSSAYLVTPSTRLAELVVPLVEEYVAGLPEPRRDYVNKVLETGGVLITPDLDSAIAFANDFAVEHLVLHVTRPHAVVTKIEHAGEILIGPNTPISACNFVVGPNAVLPTAGFARSMSSLSVRDFLHTSSVITLSAKGLQTMTDDILTLAEYEGFPGHVLAVANRPLIDDPHLEEKADTATDKLGVSWLASDPNTVSLQRKTLESRIIVQLSRGTRDTKLKERLNTGLHFLNHMLETIAWRGSFNLEVTYETPGYSLMHVVAEDVGITLGLAFHRMVQERLDSGIEGAGFAMGVIDEAQVVVAVSMEGRPSLHLEYLPQVRQHEHVEDMLTVDLENFLSGFAQGALATVHVTIRRGQDPHHTWEAVFRALGESMNACLRPNGYRAGTTPGVKGI